MSSRWLLTTMIAASCVLHAAAAAAMLISRTSSDSQFGVLDKKVDTFSLSMSQSIVLESIVTEPIEAIAAAASAMPQGSVQSVDAEATPVEMQEPKPEEVETAELVPEAVETAEEPLEVIGGSAEPAEAIEAKTVEEVVEEEPKPEEVKEVQKVEQVEEIKEETTEKQNQSSQRQTAGGASARAESVVATAASGRVTASTGNILKYGAKVRAKVARNKPPGRGRKGVAKVSFGITTSGELTYVRVASSSGNPTLDEAAITAVERSAPFGPPPTGASPDQLRFSIPFYFR